MLSLCDSMPDRQRALDLVGRLRIAASAALDDGQRAAALQAMTRDKKVRRGVVRFVLLERIGAPLVREVAPADCARALSAAVA
jgi:3-dehydroquinate synthetase